MTTRYTLYTGITMYLENIDIIADTQDDAINNLYDSKADAIREEINKTLQKKFGITIADWSIEETGIVAAEQIGE